MKKADQAKSVVEDNARKLRKERDATEQSFATKYFVLKDDRWVHTEQTTNTAGVFEADAAAASTTNATLDDTEASTVFSNKTEVSDSEDRSYL